MAKALIGLKIATGICDLIEEARECIWLMSPYMKLHKDYQAALSTLRAKPSVKLRILIGGKSYQSPEPFNLEPSDEELLFSLPNVEIRRLPELHAKYYANEKSCIAATMNISSWAHNNNYEYGILFPFESQIPENMQVAKDLRSFMEDAFTKGEKIFSNLSDGPLD